MKKILLLASLVLLSGCEVTSFEQPPLPALECDQNLVGRWLSEEEQRKPAEVELRIDGQCRIELDEHRDGKILVGEPTQLQVGSSGRNRYLWVDARWASVRLETHFQAQGHDVFVMRYQVKGDKLELHNTDDKAIAHAIIDGKIPGDVHRVDNDLVNRITGGPQPKALDLPGFFDRERIRFHRSQLEAKP